MNRMDRAEWPENEAILVSVTRLSCAFIGAGDRRATHGHEVCAKKV
jgi:hypothetical protein